MLTRNDVAGIAEQHGLDAQELAENVAEFDGDINAAVQHLLTLREQIHQGCTCHEGAPRLLKVGQTYSEEEILHILNGS